MTLSAESYARLVEALADHYSQPQSRRERVSPLETVLATALARSADPRRAEAVIAALSRGGLLEPGALAGAAPLEIQDTLREAGVMLAPSAAPLLKRLAAWFADTFPGENETIAHPARSTAEIRSGLAAVRGVGLPTADAILLALGRSTYPADRATYRILVRHGWIDPSVDYDEVSELLARQAGHNPEEIRRLAGWLGRVGRQFCGPRSPKCEQCPLSCLLPEGGPVDPEG
jgi:endonuclease-3 related protein